MVSDALRVIRISRNETAMITGIRTSVIRKALLRTSVANSTDATVSILLMGQAACSCGRAIRTKMSSSDGRAISNW